MLDIVVYKDIIVNDRVRIFVFIGLYFSGFIVFGFFC